MVLQQQTVLNTAEKSIRSIMFTKPSTQWRQNWIQQSRPYRFGYVHTGDKVDCNKLSNAHCCRFAAKTGNKVDCIGNKVDRIGNKVDRIGNSRLCCRFVASFDNDRLSTKSVVLNSLCRQCVPDLRSQRW